MAGAGLWEAVAFFLSHTSVIARVPSKLRWSAHAGEHAWARSAHFGDDIVGDHAHAQHLCQHADLRASWHAITHRNVYSYAGSGHADRRAQCAAADMPALRVHARIKHAFCATAGTCMGCAELTSVPMTLQRPSGSLRAMRCM